MGSWAFAQEFFWFRCFHNRNAGVDINNEIELIKLLFWQVEWIRLLFRGAEWIRLLSE